MLSFWFGVVTLTLGLLITFAPGSACIWFLATAGFLAPGFFIPKRKYRLAATVTCLYCLCSAYFDYWDGVTYPKRLRKHLERIDREALRRAATQQ